MALASKTVLHQDSAPPPRKCSPRRSSSLPSHHAFAQPLPHHLAQGGPLGVLRGSPDQEEPGVALPGSSSPSPVSFQAPPPLAAREPSAQPGFPGSPPAALQRSDPEESTHLQSGLGSELDATASGQRLLRGLRRRASVSSGASVRSGRPWLCACRVSVAWPGRVCL